MKSANVVSDLKSSKLSSNGEHSERILNDGKHVDQNQPSDNKVELQRNCDALVSLQSIQDALEKEIQKFEEIGSESINKEYKQMEVKLEDLFKLKIESEVENLIISNTCEPVSAMVEPQISIFEEQKNPAGKQIQILHKLKNAEHKAVILKNRAEKLEASSEQLLANEEVLKTQNSLYQYAFCFTAQVIILLVIVFVIFILRPSQTSGVVPT